MPLFVSTYGQDQALKWFVYWRLFYLACSGAGGGRAVHVWSWLCPCGGEGAGAAF
jgi:cyclopropane-fatty-acyl-phospholipid synthase